MNYIYNMSDIIFQPSYGEGCSMVILEGANIHKPIIVRNLEGYKELFHDNYLSADNNDDFASIIGSLAKKVVYQKYQAKSKKVAELFSKKTVCKIWDNFYKKIAK